MSQEKTASETVRVSTSLLGAAARDLKRLQIVFRIIARHGFGELFLRSPIGKMFFSEVTVEASADPQAPAAMRFRRLLEDLGPTYIKFGQIMSMRPDILPTSYITALEGLQDETPRVPYEAIKEAVERGLGRTMAEAFREFNPEPLATASIAQTHRAMTHSGEEVIVKVQRPGIEKTMRGDLSLLFMLSKALELGIEEMRLLAPSDLVVEFERALLSELDFTEELENLKLAREHLPSDRPVVVPKAFADLSSRTVLTMEFFRGKSLRHLAPKSPEAKHAITELLHSILKQVFSAGFFHGDPHSGNILINEEGVLCFIDFGLVGKLRTDQQADLITLVIALMARDTATLARVFLRMGSPLKRVNILELRTEISRILDKHLDVDSFANLKSRELADDFVSTAQKFQIKLAAEYSVLMKASLTVEGIVRSLYPDIDAMSIAKPFVRHMISERFSPTAILSDTKSQLMGIPDLLKQIPAQIDQILHDAQSGNLQVRSLTPELDRLPQTLHHLGSRLALTAFASMLSLIALVLFVFGRDSRLLPWLIGISALGAVYSWTTLLAWHFVQSGRPFRVTKILQFFRR